MNFPVRWRPAIWQGALLPFVLALLVSVRAAAGEAAPVAAEPPSLRFARHDLARWQARVPQLKAAASEAAAALEAATKALAEANAAKAAADKGVAESAARIAVAEPAKAASLKAVSEAIDALRKVEAEKAGDAAAIAAARAAVDAAARSLEAASKELSSAMASQKEFQAAKVVADKAVPAAEPAVKPATDRKGAADKALIEGEAALKRSQERLAAFEKSAPAPDPAATRLVATFTHDRPVLSCRFDPSGDYLFAGAEDNCLHRFDLVTSSSQHVKVHKSWLGALSIFASSNLQVLSGGHDGRLIWWSGGDPVPAALRSVDAHHGYVRAVAASHDGRLVATCGNDNLVKVWSTADGSLVKELAGHTRHVYNVEFHPSGKFLVSGDLLGIIRQWDVETWAQVRELDAKVLWKYDTGFQADVGGVRSFAFSADGKRLAAGGITDVSNAFAGIGVPCVVLFDWETGKQLKVMKPKGNPQGSVFSIRFAPAGDFLVAAGGGPAGAVWFFKPGDDTSFHSVGLPSVAYDMDLHPDGMRLAVALFDKTLRIYDLAPKFESAPAQAAK